MRFKGPPRDLLARSRRDEYAHLSALNRVHSSISRLKRLGE